MQLARYALFLLFALPLSARDDNKFITHSVNNLGEGVKIAAKAGLCLYAGYLCFDHGCKAVNHTLRFIKQIEIKNFLHNISRPTKHVLIVAGLALVAYECYQSLKHDIKWKKE